MDDLDSRLELAKKEPNPQARAVLWGECVNYVLSLEDICEGLTFDQIRKMNDNDACRLADHMQAVFEMRSSWRDDIPEPGFSDVETSSIGQPARQVNTSTKSVRESRLQIMSKRKNWPDDVARSILTKCHFRCCVCPGHRRVADIHHIDGDNSRSVESNGVGLCKTCHTDAHTTSTMQRNLLPEHLIEFKKNWEKTCEELATSLTELGLAVTNVYYMNVHRLDALLRELGEESVVSSIPHQLPDGPGNYNTLWAHHKNPLNWSQLLDNRNYFEARLKAVLNKLTAVDLNLLEVEAVGAQDQIGGLVSFDCQFIGRDIPDQNELIENCGRIDGPPPTMRRELRDPERERIRETCMMLDSQYMYADSSFIQFSEDGIWSGIARLTNIREAVGSHDGHMLRDQIVLTPICIGTPTKSVQMSTAQRGKVDPDGHYIKPLEDQQITR